MRAPCDFRDPQVGPTSEVAAVQPPPIIVMVAGQTPVTNVSPLASALRFIATRKLGRRLKSGSCATTYHQRGCSAPLACALRSVATHKMGRRCPHTLNELIIEGCGKSNREGLSCTPCECLANCRDSQDGMATPKRRLSEKAGVPSLRS